VVAGIRAELGTDPVGLPRRVWSFAPPILPWFFDDAEKIALARRSEGLYGAIGILSGMEMVGGAGPSPARWKSLFLGASARKAAVAGVGALVLPVSTPGDRSAPQEFAVRRFSGLPRAIVVPEAVVVARSRAVSTVLDDRLDPLRTAVLEEGKSLAADPRWSSAAGSVRLLSRGPGRLRVATTLPGEGVLVVFNTFEKGWRATVDGHTKSVVPADAAFQGVRLPPGKHEVELSYRPPGLATGIAAAALGLLGVGLCASGLRP
jgi:hypothetical protein